MKKMIIFTLLMTLVTITLANCAGKDSKSDQESGDFDLLISETEASYQKAGEVGGQWRDIEKLITQAKQAYRRGDRKQAFKRARQAKKQAELGYQQALEQQNAEPWLF